MSEKLKQDSPESSSGRNHESKAQLDKLAERLKNDAEKAPDKKERSQEAVRAGKSAEKLATASKELAPKSKEKEAQPEPVNHGIKKQTYRATMNRVEARLPAYQRTFSRFINNDFVDKTSNIAAKTVARPSALLGGGLTAFVGLVIVTYYANTLGFEISGSEFILLVAIGWAAGLVVEGLYKGIKHLVK
jgi:hypothetical protein